MIINIILQIKADCLNSKIIEINLNAFIKLLLSKNDLKHHQYTYPKTSRFFIDALGN